MNSPIVAFAVYLLFASAANAQYAVRGTVSDEAGRALVGVNIVVKGTTQGTTTDGSGGYQIAYRNPDAVLVFSYVGYRKQEIRPGGKTQLDVVMQEGMEFSEVLVVGTRSMNRTVTETPVAIDVLDLSDLTNHQGQLDVNQLLQYAAPSFNANRQSGADGSDHIDPATLRGLGPDQTLVLINGKRRHQSSNINIFGTRGRGNTGTDLNAIPASAIERIEILRDGASAQYGSDAIAGVVNVVLKSSVNEFTGSVGGGGHSTKFRADKDFDGEEYLLGSNYGVPLGKSGFANFTMEYLSKGRTNRPADPAVYSIYRRQFGDAKLENFAALFNSAAGVSEDAHFYAFGGLNYRHTDAYAWTREPGSDRNVPGIYPGGFDPRITSVITDPSVSAGLRTRLNEWNVDLNNTFGSNRFHYIIDGTLNASLLESSPTRFDAGGFQLAQNTTSINFSRFFNTVMSGLNLAFGIEYRIENYEIFAGEEGSWRNYGVIDTVINGRVENYDILGRPGGSQGFPGFRPDNVLDESRTNVAAYADAELDFSRQFMVGAAARLEDYSDFGRTFNVKVSSRLKLSDALALRASASTGFRAPSLAQIYFNSVFTDFVSGTPVDKLIAKNNSPITRRLGIPALKEETATNLSFGLTLTFLEGLTATVDAYQVDIKDRIVLTGAFEDTDPDIGTELQALNVGAAQFFTNALDTKTTGLDIILTYSIDLAGSPFRISYAGNFNDMDLGKVKTSPKLAGKEDIYFGKREQFFLLASAPPSKMTIALDYGMNRWRSSLRFVRFGKVTLIDWLDTEDVYEARVTTDFSVGYDLTNNISLVFGGVNLLNVYPKDQDTETETGGIFDAVQMGFSGRFYFAKLNFRL
ncbi:MAG: TonB-dependent receptor [Ignavibacteriales bacterium]|nr:TonB-dependent receptor [Ignavibacteriales bacterium]